MQIRTAAIALTLLVLAGCAAQRPDIAAEEASRRMVTRTASRAAVAIGAAEASL